MDNNYHFRHPLWTPTLDTYFITTQQNTYIPASASQAMGNVTSAKRGDRQPFAIEYVARYVSITKDQFKDLRSRCYMDMDSRRKIDRYTFSSNVQLSNIKDCKDVEILDCLFTMWDVHGEDLVLCPPFILSLVPLVCPNESFEKIITFALEVFQSETKGILTADRLVFILKRTSKFEIFFERDSFTHTYFDSLTIPFIFPCCFALQI